MGGLVSLVRGNRGCRRVVATLYHVQHRQPGCAGGQFLPDRSHGYSDGGYRLVRHGGWIVVYLRGGYGLVSDGGGYPLGALPEDDGPLFP